MKITANQFETGEWMPDLLSGYGENKSPEILIEGLPKETVSIAITMDDLDHPIKPGFNHWIAWNIEPVCRIPGNLPKGAMIDEPIYAEQGLGYGRHCYKGPKPPFKRIHRYAITVYALDKKLRLGKNSRKKDLIKAIEDHVLDESEIIGKYQRGRGQTYENYDSAYGRDG